MSSARSPATSYPGTQYVPAGQKKIYPKTSFPTERRNATGSRGEGARLNILF